MRRRTQFRKSRLFGVWRAQHVGLVIRNHIDERRTRTENRATDSQNVEDYPAIAVGEDEDRILRFVSRMGVIPIKAASQKQEN